MTENSTPEIPITVTTVERDALTLLPIIRADITRQVQTVLTSQDSAAHVIVSVVKNGVFVSCLVEQKDGKYRFGDITPESIYELWQLKKQQYTPDKGAWFSVQFRASNDGFISQTSYNYDKLVYSGNTPEGWYTAPETETEEYKQVWDLEDYKEDIDAFPRKGELPEWLQ